MDTMNAKKKNYFQRRQMLSILLLPRIVIDEGEADSATVSVYWGCEGDDAAPARDVLLV